jgi:quercetin dioxygenase-like cupin family protein
LLSKISIAIALNLILLLSLVSLKNIYCHILFRVFSDRQYIFRLWVVKYGEPICSVVTQSEDAVVVAWYVRYVKPGQEISPHIHPNGQDTWTILSGKGEYYLDRVGTKKSIVAGDLVVADRGCIHGVVNNGIEPLIFISVVAPADAGYQLVSLEDSLILNDSG